MNTVRLSRSMLLALAVAGIAGCAMNSPSTAVPPASGVSFGAPGASSPQHKTFRYTGKVQTFVVPPRVTSLAVIVIGAAGGGNFCTGTNCTAHQDYFGRGGRIYALIPVRPHETLYMFVGGQGTSLSGGFNGGGNPGQGGGSNGGGGASDIRTGYSLRDRLVVGGGGGGEGSDRASLGGIGGGKIGGDGGTSCYSGSNCGGGGGGYGATQNTGGAGGAGGGSGSGQGQKGARGVFARGGDGGDGGNGGCYTSSSSCACGYSRGCPGAGGGGGYFGGGGGGGGQSEYSSITGGAGGGGGGGTSWAEKRAVNVKTWSGWNTAFGNGLIVVKWR